MGNTNSMFCDGRWGELESGQTTIAFTPLHQHETDEVTGTVQTPQPKRGERNPIELCFDYADVDAAYKVLNIHKPIISYYF